jgi:hypothetical protein
LLQLAFLVSGNVYAASLSYPGDCKASKLQRKMDVQWKPEVNIGKYIKMAIL